MVDQNALVLVPLTAFLELNIAKLCNDSANASMSTLVACEFFSAHPIGWRCDCSYWIGHGELITKPFLRASRQQDKGRRDWTAPTYVSGWVTTGDEARLSVVGA